MAFVRPDMMMNIINVSFKTIFIIRLIITKVTFMRLRPNVNIYNVGL